jgi:hypothetical protein
MKFHFLYKETAVLYFGSFIYFFSGKKTKCDSSMCLPAQARMRALVSQGLSTDTSSRYYVAEIL